MTVRLRLALWNALVIALIVGGLGMGLRHLVRQNLTDGIENELKQRAEGFRLMVRGMPRTPQGDPGPPPDGAFRRPPRPNDAIGPRVFHADGRNMMPGDARPPFDRDSLRRAQETGKPVSITLRPPGETPLLVYSVPVAHTPFADNIILQFSASLESVEREVTILTTVLLTQIPIALAISIIGALFLTDRALRPVIAVTKAAAEIEATDLSRRLPVAGKDEFSRLAETLNGMLGRLESAFAQQRRFVADASHELKSPLTIIKANSSLTLADPMLPENARVALQEIDSAADRTTRVVQDLLLLARSDAGDLTPNRERFPLRSLLEELARQARRQHPDGPTIEITAPENLQLNADPEQIRRLLTNLLDNALRHTPADGRITLSAHDEGDAIELIVRDTGEGIALEHLARLGERFYRPDDARARATGGTGLGLSICRAIAEAHGGALIIESIQGKGTSVTMRFSAKISS